MSFGQIPSLIAFSPTTTILSASVNSNFTNITNQFNALVTATNTLAPFTVSAGPITVNGISISGGVVSGVATFSSGWTISAGTASFVSGTTVSATAATFLGALTFSSGITLASGSTLTASGITAVGAINATAVTLTGALTLASGAKLSGDLLSNTGNEILGSSGTPFAAVYGGVINCFASGTQLSLVAQATVVRVANAANVPTNFLTNNTTQASIPAAGGFVVGTATLTTAATSGFLYIPTMPTTGSGTPATQTGTAPMAICTTNNTLQVFVGGAWKGVALT